MKRDMDLVRKILFDIEDNASGKRPYQLNIENANKEDIDYHLILLRDAKLIEVETISNWGGKSISPIRLTWEGHDFLDAARDESRWNKAKEIVKEKGGGMTFEVIKAVLVQLARQAVGLP